MAGVEHTLLVLLLILFIGLVIPELFQKFRVPFVSSVIVLGALLGPNGADIVQSTESIEFFGFLGFAFLMLLAGLETRLHEMKESAKGIGIMAAINSSIPFVVGVGITKWFGYDWQTALLIGVVFISSSVAIIIPALEGVSISKKVRQWFVSSVVVQDMLSLIILAVIFQYVSPVIDFPLPVYILVLLSAFGALKLVLPNLAEFFIKKRRVFKHEEHEDRLRFVIVMLMAVLAFFSVLGVHPILAAFLVGVLLSEQLTHEQIVTKIHTLGYGLFVPVFFFVIGMQMDLHIFTNLSGQSFVVLAIPLALVLSKFVSGYLGARVAQLNSRQAKMYGVATMTQLTTTLAAAYAANSVGLLDETLLTAIVLLSVVTTLLGPLLLKIFFQKPAVKVK